MMGHILVSDIQNYFEHILKKHNEKIDNTLIKVHENKIENRITFKIKTGYYLKLLTPESMNVQHCEITEVILVHCNTVNNDYQQDSRVLYIFVPNKPFGNLLEIAATNFIPLKIFNSEFQTI